MTNQFDALRRHLEQAIVGQHALLERLLISLLADGHLLVEGLPGLAKTTAVRALASGLAMRFQRIQFTPDMIPGDITGTDIFVPRDGHFEFVEGPVFSDVILADEINRAPPKVQSALLEAMQERQVTVGTTTRALPPVFLVMATQNPIDHEGTYPLPEAQLDRFLLKVQLGYPTQDEELEILRRVSRQLASDTTAAILPVLASDDVLAARREVNSIYLDAMLERYIVALVSATRDPSPRDPELGQWLERGASPRATLALARAGKARAWLHGRDFVEPGDLLELAHDVLNHRIAPSFTARAEGIGVARIIERLLDIVPVP